MASGSGSGNSSSHSVTRPAPRVLKVLCSYGGRIGRYRPPKGSRIVYYGGIDKLVSLKRDISYADIINRLSNLFNLTMADNHVLKYQLPGLDLDVLISITNDEDLKLMMREYDDTFMMPQRFRLFLDPPEVTPLDYFQQPYVRQPQYNFQHPYARVPQRTTARVSVMNTGTTLAPTPSLPHGPPLSAQLQRLKISDDDKNKNVQMSGCDETTSEEHVQDLPLPAAMPGPTSAIGTTATPTPAAEKADATESS